MLYGKLLLLKPNVLVMDEPTNHMDMESIESLNMALEKYNGTLIFVSHDRQFVSSLATQIIELDGKGGYEHYLGDYESYLEKKRFGLNLYQQSNKALRCRLKISIFSDGIFFQN